MKLDLKKALELVNRGELKDPRYSDIVALRDALQDLLPPALRIT